MCWSVSPFFTQVSFPSMVFRNIFWCGKVCTSTKDCLIMVHLYLVMTNAGTILLVQTLQTHSKSSVFLHVKTVQLQIHTYCKIEFIQCSKNPRVVDIVGCLWTLRYGRIRSVWTYTVSKKQFAFSEIFICTNSRTFKNFSFVPVRELSRN